MSSTYSSDLRIQLMGTGDQAGTWGATTNNNFQYIFEQSIAGVQTVSVTATPQALTYVNGATSTLANNQAIAAALIFTNGGVNANFTITTPSGSQKLYIIYNNTSYTATMQVTGSSGSTVTIPSQITTKVYTDGTNFFAGNTGSVGNFAIAGTGTATTPSTGDSSTKIATTAFVSAAVQAAYPVGSIYMNASVSTNPGTLLGFGTWSVIASGQMLLGNGSGYTAGSTGGSATTTLYTANLPSHTHGASGLSASSSTSISINDPGHAHQIVDPTAYVFLGNNGNNGTSAKGAGTSGPTYTNTASATTGLNGGNVTANTTTSISGSTAAAGSGTAVTTISPYLVVYMWQRTA